MDRETGSGDRETGSGDRVVGRDREWGQSSGQRDREWGQSSGQRDREWGQSSGQRDKEWGQSSGQRDREWGRGVEMGVGVACGDHVQGPGGHGKGLLSVFTIASTSPGLRCSPSNAT